MSRCLSRPSAPKEREGKGNHLIVDLSAKGLDSLPSPLRGSPEMTRLTCESQAGTWLAISPRPIPIWHGGESMARNERATAGTPFRRQLP
jgi:hypothetical protein